MVVMRLSSGLTSVVAGNQQNLRFSAEFDESPGNLENPATAPFEALKQENRYEQKLKAVFPL